MLGENEGCENMGETWERLRELAIISSQLRLGDPSCTNISRYPFKGVSTRLCSSSNGVSNPQHALFMPKLAPNPKGSSTLSLMHRVKGKDELD